MKSFSTLFLLTCLLLVAIASAQTTRRVVIEEFTGAWCGACPDAAIKIEEIEHDYPDNTIGLAWHEWDDLRSPNGRRSKPSSGCRAIPVERWIGTSLPEHPASSCRIFRFVPVSSTATTPGHCLRGHVGSVI